MNNQRRHHARARSYSALAGRTSRHAPAQGRRQNMRGHCARLTLCRRQHSVCNCAAAGEPESPAVAGEMINGEG